MIIQNLLQIDLLFQVSGITPGRLPSIIAGVVGLISVVIGWLALTRSARSISSGRPMAISALVVALIGIVISVRHLATTTGAFGTGSGRAGAIVALVIGLIGIFFGGKALARSRRIATGSSTAKAASPRERT